MTTVRLPWTLLTLACLPPAACTDVTGIDTGEPRAIVSHPARQVSPAIWGDRVVWQDNRNGNWDIYMLDLSTEEELQITDDPADQTTPDIHGDRVIWVDVQIVGEESPLHAEYAIHAHDLKTGKERTISTGTGNRSPRVFGDYAVWQWESGETFHVYAHDFCSGETRRLSESGKGGFHPNIWEDPVVWIKPRGGAPRGPELPVLFDLATGEASLLVENPRSNLSRPSIGPRSVVWAEKNEQLRIRMLDIGTRTEQVISDPGSRSDNPELYGDLVVCEARTKAGHWVRVIDVHTRRFAKLDDGPSFDPDIWNRRVVWVRWVTTGDADIYMTEIPR